MTLMPRGVSRAAFRALADLVSRGLSADDGLLVVIDGAKALAAAVREVLSAQALVQHPAEQAAQRRRSPAG